MKYIFLVFGVYLLLGCKNSAPVQHFGVEDLHIANRKLLEIAMEDGFSPPVASRVYVYPHLSFYTALHAFYPDSLLDITAKINGFPTHSPAKSKADPELTALICYWTIAKTLIFSENQALEAIQNLESKAKELHFTEDVINDSKEFAKQFCDSVSLWIKKDNYAYTRTLDRYTSKKNPAHWSETPPDYTAGLEPNWPKIRRIILDSSDSYVFTPLPPYSTDKKSPFYLMAEEVYQQAKILDSSLIQTAWYWDDNPNVSKYNGHLMTIIHKISPPGHWLNIISDLCKSKKTDLFTSTTAYMLCSMVMFDGIIDCWDTKYKMDVVRPISYIMDNIDAEWKPLIQTPPFPEFTSGHSVISAAAAEILSEIFGRTLPFVDSTEKLFGFDARNFSNFHEAAMEVSLSRFYGGIHYKQSVLEGNKQGKYIAQQLMQKISYPSTQ